MESLHHSQLLLARFGPNRQQNAKEWQVAILSTANVVVSCSMTTNATAMPRDIEGHIALFVDGAILHHNITILHNLPCEWCCDSHNIHVLCDECIRSNRGQYAPPPQTQDLGLAGTIRHMLMLGLSREIRYQ